MTLLKKKMASKYWFLLILEFCAKMAPDQRQIGPKWRRRPQNDRNIPKRCLRPLFQYKRVARRHWAQNLFFRKKIIGSRMGPFGGPCPSAFSSKYILCICYVYVSRHLNKKIGALGPGTLKRPHFSRTFNFGPFWAKKRAWRRQISPHVKRE